MLILGILLLLSPTILFGLDQLNVPIPVDPLNWAVAIGLLGVILLGHSQRHAGWRVLAVAAAAIVVLLVQFWLIAVTVLQVNFG